MMTGITHREISTIEPHWSSIIVSNTPNIFKQIQTASSEYKIYL